MTIRITGVLASALLLGSVAAAQAQYDCRHGPGNGCGGKGRYPIEQLNDPGWCESHFVVVNGVREHRCPAPWTKAQIKAKTEKR